KVPLYAEMGIPQVWIVNLNKDVIKVYSEPVNGRYERMSTVGRGEVLALPGELEGSISVDEVLG
nr:Uma2 family endonuclease [Candidatus Eremiobacteraeota bacterium]